MGSPFNSWEWRDCRLAPNGSDVEKNCVNVDLGFTYGLNRLPLKTQIEAEIRWKKTARVIAGVLSRNSKYLHGIEGFCLSDDWPQPPDETNFEIRWTIRGEKPMTIDASDSMVAHDLTNEEKRLIVAALTTAARGMAQEDRTAMADWAIGRLERLIKRIKEGLADDE